MTEFDSGLADPDSSANIKYLTQRVTTALAKSGRRWRKEPGELSIENRKPTASLRRKMLLSTDDKRH